MVSEYSDNYDSKTIICVNGPGPDWSWCRVGEE